MINKNLIKQIVKEYKEGLGTDTIAKEFNLGKTTIRKYLLSRGIKLRPATKDIVSKDLHEKFVKLYKKGNSMKQISIKCSSTFATVRRHLHKEGVKLRRRRNPNLIKYTDYKKLTPEKAYVLGVVGPSDGFIEYRMSNGQYRICLEAIDIDFIRYFSFCLEKTYGIKPKIKKIKPRGFGINPTFIVRLGSKQACDDLLQYGVSFREKNWAVPSFIKYSNNYIKAKYLQGFADSQGCVAFHPKTKCILLASKNKKGLLELKKQFSALDILTSIRKQGIAINGRSFLKKYYDKIGFKIYRKQKILENMLTSYKYNERTKWT